MFYSKRNALGFRKTSAQLLFKKFIILFYIPEYETMFQNTIKSKQKTDCLINTSSDVVANLAYFEKCIVVLSDKVSH